MAPGHRFHLIGVNFRVPIRWEKENGLIRNYWLREQLLRRERELERELDRLQKCPPDKHTYTCSVVAFSRAKPNNNNNNNDNGNTVLPTSSEMRVASLLASAAVVVLSIVSTTFVFLALTSTEWSTQTYFFAVNGQSDGSTDVSSVCMAGRSPFYRCGIPSVNENRTCIVPACSFYRASGVNLTSCRSAAELGIGGNDDVGAMGLLGGAQECQQGKERPSLAV